MTSYPARHSTRLGGYDYAQAGAYAVTLCIEGRQPLLGCVREGQMLCSPAGAMVASVWSNLESYYGVGIDVFVVMPNHIHGIVVMPGGAREDSDQGGQRRSSVPTARTGGISLSTVMQRFKTFTAHEYRNGVAASGWPRYAGRLWQHRFYEHVIRHERELTTIRQYILDNPLQWQLDRENPSYQA